jgi:hypothetical protein
MWSRGAMGPGFAALYRAGTVPWWIRGRSGGARRTCSGRARRRADPTIATWSSERHRDDPQAGDLNERVAGIGEHLTHWRGVPRCKRSKAPGARRRWLDKRPGGAYVAEAVAADGVWRVVHRGLEVGRQEPAGSAAGADQESKLPANSANTAPCGSWITPILPIPMSIGPISVVPPSSVDLASDASMSSVPKYTSQ